MKLKINSSQVRSAKNTQEAIAEYNTIRYGLRHYAWNARDKKAIWAEKKAKGIIDAYRIAPGEYDFDSYNLDLWNEFNEDFMQQTELNQDQNTVKAIADKIKEMCIYLIENYNVISFNTLVFKKGKTLTGDRNVKVKLNFDETYSIISPDKTIEIKVFSDRLEMITDQIIPIKNIEILAIMTRYAEIIFNKFNSEDLPILLSLDEETESKLELAKLFLTEQNFLALDKLNDRKNDQPEQIIFEGQNKSTKFQVRL